MYYSNCSNCSKREISFTINFASAVSGEEIRKAGGRIDAVYTCTELEEDHPMRKPQPGMFLEARRDFPDIAPERSLMIGDSESDRHFAANCGMSFVLMETAELAMDRATT